MLLNHLLVRQFLLLIWPKCLWLSSSTCFLLDALVLRYSLLGHRRWICNSWEVLLVLERCTISGNRNILHLTLRILQIHLSNFAGLISFLLLLLLIQIRELISHGHAIEAIYVATMTYCVVWVRESIVLRLLLLDLPLLLVHNLLLLCKIVLKLLFVLQELLLF